MFTENGQLYSNCYMIHRGFLRAEARCYPLLPAEGYRGPEPKQFTYEGREGHYGHQTFKLGPKVRFIASEPSVDEWREVLRVLYADGGSFACQASYADFLHGLPAPIGNEEAARTLELKNGLGAFDKATLLGWLDPQPMPSLTGPAQLDFEL